MLDFNLAQIFIQFAVLLFSLTIHEMAHAWTADRLGDPTARLLGRVSFNPIVRLEWPTPEKLYVETAYVTFRSELIKTFSRWHLITLSPQAVVLGRG